MAEIIRGIWIGNISIKNEAFIQKYKIDKVLDCATHFEKDVDLEENYKFKHRVDSFLEKALNLLLDVHYLNNKKCLIVCRTGKRISNYIGAHYISKLARIEYSRALQIINTKISAIDNIAPNTKKNTKLNPIFSF
jgi:hypothetical protein